MATKMTMNGISTTQPGQEQYEQFSWGFGRRQKTAYQYDYRKPDGELFSCCAPTVEECRRRRDEWLKTH